MRTMTLILDDDDHDTIQAEIAKRQANCRWPSDNESPGLIDPDGPPKSGAILPDGDSNLAGSMIAEMIRDLDEYRAIYNEARGREG